MTKLNILRVAGVAALLMWAAACASSTPTDLTFTTPEFHGAVVGKDELRSRVPSEN